MIITRPCFRSRLIRRAFTMVEILLAMLILGIGLIMIATVLPVGADWNRENIEESLASEIARNAVAIIRTRYTRTDMPSGANANLVVPIPSIDNKLPLAERAYAYGASPAYPAVTPGNALYWWTAMVRQTPDPYATIRNRYDIYILVFKKGSIDQTFTNGGGLGRGSADAMLNLTPYVLKDTQADTLVVGGSAYNAFTVGSDGIGETSGTVFHKLGSTSANAASTPLAASENVFYVPPADGASASPLIYIYQTTVAF
jgi:prepilin-type N-terminal cleavage/methylation domain-containing protein